MRKLDLTGQTIGRLTILAESVTEGATRIYWHCLCSCGANVEKSTSSLRNNKTPSCGCWKSEALSAAAKITSYKHGLSSDPMMRLMLTAKGRAKRNGIPFDLTFDALSVPEYCPVLGLKLEHGVKRHQQNSPSLDRVDNTKGYTKDNVRVISRRANCLKNDSTVEELEAVLRYMKGEV